MQKPIYYYCVDMNKFTICDIAGISCLSVSSIAGKRTTFIIISLNSFKLFNSFQILSDSSDVLYIIYRVY